MHRLTIVICFVVLAVVAAAPVHAENRIALVIGNDRYPNLSPDQQLSKAVNDARAIGDTLEKIGFSVIRGENLDRRGMVDRLFEFTRRIQPGDVAVVFYAGHGVALSGGNYLLPTDIPLPQPGEESRIRNIAIGEADMVADVQERKARVIVLMLDACRDNPFRQPGVTRSIGSTRGLTRGTEAQGVFAVYSAGFGQQALDSLGPNDTSPNSVFTRALIPQLTRRDTHLGELIIDMREQVARLAASIGHEQYPAYYDQTRGGRVYLAARSIATEPAAAAAAAPPQQVLSTPPAATAPPSAVVQPPPPPAVERLAPPPKQVARLSSVPPRVSVASASGYPRQTITLVVPFSPGGFVDIIARTLAGELSEALGSVIVVNKAGGGGAVAAQYVAASRPDGYTLLISDSFPLTAAPHFAGARPPPKLKPVFIFARIDEVLVVAPSSPVRSVSDVIAMARRGGTITYAASGVGTSSHLAGELFLSAAGISMKPIAMATSELPLGLANGLATMAVLSATSALPRIQSGQLRALAVTGLERNRLFPDVPTLRELGLDVDAERYYGLYGPSGTPTAVVDALVGTLSRLNTRRIEGLNVSVGFADSETHAQILKQEEAKWSRLIAQRGLGAN